MIPHAPGVMTYSLAPERPVPRFKPGQFLQLSVDPYDPSQPWPDSRAFSIASPPESRSLLRITVSVVGRLTERIGALEAGNEVWIKLPYGEFVVDPRPDDVTIILSGGTGITPFISLFASDHQADGPVRVLYGARTPDLLIYRRALDQAAERWPDFKWFPFIESGDYPGAVLGRLSASFAVEIARSTGPVENAVFYLSGPPAMLSALKSDLLSEKISPERIRMDAWQ